MQEQCTAFSERLLGLAQEWDTHRQPLVEALSEKEDILNKVSISIPDRVAFICNPNFEA